MWGLCAAWGAGHGLKSLTKGRKDLDQPHLRQQHVDRSIQLLVPANPEGLDAQ